MFRRFMIIAAATLTLSAAASADQGGTADEARAMLDKAVAAVKADKTKALETFNKGQGGFLDRDLYVFCAEADGGKIVANGNPNAKKLLGTDLRKLKDSNGKPYGEEIFTAGQKLFVSKAKQPKASFQEQLRHQSGRSVLRRRLLQIDLGRGALRRLTPLLLQSVRLGNCFVLTPPCQSARMGRTQNGFLPVKRAERSTLLKGV
jgi:hypothetical protein